MNWIAVKSIYTFEMARFFRTITQSLISPVLSTSLYFVVFGAAIGSRIQEVEGISYRGDHPAHGVLLCGHHHSASDLDGGFSGADLHQLFADGLHHRDLGGQL